MTTQTQVEKAIDLLVAQGRAERVSVNGQPGVRLRSDLIEAERQEAARIGRIEFKSAGARRQK